MCSVISPVKVDSCSAKSITFCLALSDVYGGLLKYTASIETPLLAIINADTGLSMPPDNKTVALPEVPTGKPPKPFIILLYTYT